MNYTNKRGGKLTLLQYKRAGGPGVGAIWTALCDCGKTKEVLARKVIKGAVTSCGTCDKSDKPSPILQGLPKGHLQAYLRLLNKSNNIDLNIREYTEITQKRCIACNISKTYGEWGEPKGPYNSTNLIPICTECSEMRRGRSIRKTLEWLIRVHRHLQRISMSEFR